MFHGLLHGGNVLSYLNFMSVIEAGAPVKSLRL